MERLELEAYNVTNILLKKEEIAYIIRNLPLLQVHNSIFIIIIHKNKTLQLF